jgi:hypothetical protein
MTTAVVDPPREGWAMQKKYVIRLTEDARAAFS